MRSPKSLRVTLPMVLAALVLSVAGSLSTASATTYWRYQNSWEGNCLTASPTTANVWTTTCDESSANQNWWWGVVHRSARIHLPPSDQQGQRPLPHHGRQEPEQRRLDEPLRKRSRPVVERRQQLALEPEREVPPQLRQR